MVQKSIEVEVYKFSQDHLDDVSYIREASGISIKGNYSSKIEAILKLVLKLRSEDENVKVLIFSTWDAVLKILNLAFNNNEIKGRLMLTHTFQKCLDDFKDSSQKVAALFLPVRLGSKGLNLIEASHFIFVEPLLNLADELQAIGRVHRLGQTKQTTVHKFVIKNTIEESIHQSISSNTESWDQNKVTMQQLRSLFHCTTEVNVIEAGSVEEGVNENNTGERDLNEINQNLIESGSTY